PAGEHVDRTGVEFRTLDPAAATDLDQAFAIEVAEADIILRYAIADVGFFVDRGGPIDIEAWRPGRPPYPPRARPPPPPPPPRRGCPRLRCARGQPACSPTGRGRPSCSSSGSTPTAMPSLTAPSAP